MYMKLDWPSMLFAMNVHDESLLLLLLLLLLFVVIVVLSLHLSVTLTRSRASYLAHKLLRLKL